MAIEQNTTPAPDAGAPQPTPGLIDASMLTDEMIQSAPWRDQDRLTVARATAREAKRTVREAEAAKATEESAASDKRVKEALKPLIEGDEDPKAQEEHEEQQPPAKEIIVSNVGAEHRAEAEQYSMDLSAIAADVGIPVEEAQVFFDFAMDLALIGTPGLNLQNPEECMQSLNTRYGENAKAIVADAQAAVRRLGQDVAAYLNATGAGNDPGTLLALAEFHRGTTKLSKDAASKELAKIRASKEFQKGDRYVVDRARLISAIAYRGNKNEVSIPAKAPTYKTAAMGNREKLESELRTIRLSPGYSDRYAADHKALVNRVNDLMGQLHPEA